VVGLDEGAGFEAYQGHAWRLEAFYFVHVLLCHLYLLPSQGVVRTHHTVEQHLAAGVELLCYALQQLVCFSVHLFGRRAFGLGEKGVDLDTDLYVFLLAFLVEFLPNF
jgi:hypothetical protein